MTNPARQPAQGTEASPSEPPELSEPDRDPDGGPDGGWATATPTSPPASDRRIRAIGLAVLVVGVAVSVGVNQLLPAVSALTVAVVFGFVTGNLPLRRTLPAYGATMASLARPTKVLLRSGVVLLGLQLAVPDVLALGGWTLLAVVITVAATFGASLGLGRLLGLSREAAILVGTGVSICGASAVAAMEGVCRRRREEDVATALAVVTVFGTIALAVLPLLADLFGLSAEQTGTWAGMSVHEVAQVVAAASPAGTAAISVAVIVKLSRVILLAPLVAGVGMVERRRADDGAAPADGTVPADGTGKPADGKRPPLVPAFVLGFLAMVVVTSTGLVPDPVLSAAKLLSTLCLAAALFGLGTSIQVGPLLRTGGRTLVLGLCVSVLMSLLALGAALLLL